MQGQYIYKYQRYFHLQPKKHHKYNVKKGKLLGNFRCKIYSENDWFNPDNGPGYMYSKLDFLVRGKDQKKIQQWATQLKLYFLKYNIFVLKITHL